MVLCHNSDLLIFARIINYPDENSQRIFAFSEKGGEKRGGIIKGRGGI